jgi:hypothetical protein
MTRNGYLLHSATGKFDDKQVTPPFFYGKTDWGKFNMKVSPDRMFQAQSGSFYLPSELPAHSTSRAIASRLARAYTHGFERCYQLVRTGDPFDNMGAEIKIQELLVLFRSYLTSLSRFLQFCGPRPMSAQPATGDTLLHTSMDYVSSSRSARDHKRSGFVS